MKKVDCKKIMDRIIDDTKFWNKMYGVTSGELHIISANNDDASKVYIRNKVKMCNEVGIDCHVHNIEIQDTDVMYNGIIDVISSIKKDNKLTKIHGVGVMIQLPLHENVAGTTNRLINSVPYYLDVDGLSSESVGKLWNGETCITPATPTGILSFLPYDLSGVNILVIGRSKLVGNPLIKLLQDRNATVISCHSRTNKRFIEDSMKNCDVIISAIGKAQYFNLDKIFESYKDEDVKLFIDVGINRDRNGKLCGDFKYSEDILPNCYITPVPNGVGKLTTAQLVANVYKTTMCLK